MYVLGNILNNILWKYWLYDKILTFWRVLFILFLNKSLAYKLNSYCEEKIIDFD